MRLFNKKPKRMANWPSAASPRHAEPRRTIHRKRLRLESLEDRRVLSGSSYSMDLNGPAPGVDFAAERASANGLVAIVSHNLAIAGQATGPLASATATIVNPMSGDTLGVLTHGTHITASYSDGVLQLSGTDSVANYQQVLRTARFNSTAIRDVGTQVHIDFKINDGTADSTAAHSVVTTIDAGTGTVAARHIFYNDSSFDGNDAGANAADDGAIASDKQVLPFDQTATAANYTSYTRGLNGIMIDIAGPHGTITPEDFIFQVGNNDFPDTWAAPPEPVSVITRAGAGQGGSDRVELTWANGAISNEWLGVVVAANHDTGLAKPDTFYFGNVTGETGNSRTDATVSPIDLARVVDRLLVGPVSAAIGDPLDFNRDGLVSTADMAAIVDHLATAPPSLQVVNIESIAQARINTTFSTGLIDYYFPQVDYGTFQVFIIPPTPLGPRLPNLTIGPTTGDQQIVIPGFTGSISAYFAAASASVDPVGINASLDLPTPFDSQ